ncbi:MAG: glycosyltransferase [Tepidisphaeraceae bacterium]
MTRVLHLMPTDADFQTARAVEQLSVGSAGQNVVVTIGHGGTYPTALAAGIALRRRRHGSDATAIVHAWGGEALIVAALATRGPLVYSPAPSPSKRSVRWARAVAGHREVQVVCPTSTLRRLHVERGVALERCHLIRPGVDFARIKRRRNPALRAALGLAESDVVLLVPGESTREAHHERALWAAAILGELDPKYRLLLWGRGPRAVVCERFAVKLHQSDLAVLAEQRLGRRVEFEELLAATDIVLATPRGLVPTLPLSICMAAALPIVSTTTYTATELLANRHTALLVTKPVPRLLAQRVLELLDDRGIQWTISDMARTEAYEYFAQTRFLEQFRALYRQVAGGEKAHVPEPSPGAGLRFHGRG